MGHESYHTNSVIMQYDESIHWGVTLSGLKLIRLVWHRAEAIRHILAKGCHYSCKNQSTRQFAVLRLVPAIS